MRTLQLNHILCTQEGCLGSSSRGLYGIPKVRLRINCIGVVDVLEFETRKGIEELQQQDMRALGCLLLSMTTGTEISVSDVYRNNTSHRQQTMFLDQYLGFVRQNYSRDLRMLMETLLNPALPSRPVRDISASMAARVFEEMDGIHSSMDHMHDAMMGVYESGRALRLMLKLAFVNER